MNETEFLERLNNAGIKVDSKLNIYGVGCHECVSYMMESDSNNNHNSTIKWEVTVRGKMDGKDYEFKSLEDAQAAVEQHRSKKPLHNPYVAAKPVVEYLTHTDK